MRSISKPVIRVVAGYYFVCIILGMIEASLGPILPSLAEKTGVSLSKASLIFSTHGLGYLIGSLLGGRLYDLKPGHKILSGVMAMGVITLAFIPSIKLFWFLPLIFFLVGFLVAATDVGINTLLIWIMGSAVAPFMNGLHLFFGLGTFLIPLLISGMTSLSGAPGKAYWVLAVLLLPIIFYLLQHPSPQMNAVSKTSIKSRKKPYLVIMIIALFFLITGTEFSFGGWIYSYALYSELVGPLTAAYLTSAYWGSLTLARLVSIPVALRFRSQTILQSGMLIGLAGLGILLIFPASLTAVWIGTIAVGAGMATLFPVTLTWLGEHFQLDGSTTGLFFMGGSLGNMIMPWLVGQFFERSGPSVMVIICMLELAAAVLLLRGIMFLIKRLNPPGIEAAAVVESPSGVL